MTSLGGCVHSPSPPSAENILDLGHRYQSRRTMALVEAAYQSSARAATPIAALPLEK
jgi:hypothetical protein